MIGWGNVYCRHFHDQKTYFIDISSGILFLQTFRLCRFQVLPKRPPWILPTKMRSFRALKFSFFTQKLPRYSLYTALCTSINLTNINKHQYRWSIKNVTILMRILTSEARACPAAPAQRCVREIELATHLWRQ